MDGDAFALYGGAAKDVDRHCADIAGEVAVGAGVAAKGTPWRSILNTPAPML